MTRWLLHYKALAEFRSQFYKNLLTLEHLKGGMISIDKFTTADGEENDYSFWGWELNKGNERYLLPARRLGETGPVEVKLHDMLPLFAEQTTKIAYRGQVYNLILKPKSMRFRPTKHYSFKTLVNNLTSLKHTNPDHYKLLWFLGLASMMDRAYFRVCSPPSMGKSSVVDTLGHLIGSASKIVKPTLAKLELRTSYKWMVLDEANDMTGAAWKEIDQFLLDVAAFSPSIEKHSKAMSGGKESYDISQFSMSLFYNDVNDYSDKSEYFDDITKRALRDRFPAFRVYGGFEEDFNSIRSTNVAKYVEENIPKYRELIETFTYFKQNLHSSIHWWKIKPIQHMPERWRQNVDTLFKIIDMYCESQEEFDRWVDIVSDSIQDYYEMGKYPALFERAKKKYSQADIDEMKKKVRTLNTFKEKNELVANYDGFVFNKQVKSW